MDFTEWKPSVKLAKSPVGFSCQYLITVLLKTEIRFFNEEPFIYYSVQ